MRSKIEFYDNLDESMVASVSGSSIVPTVGSHISIRGETWEVTDVVYALDHADDYTLRQMRASVWIKL